jgi:hypothetical protein
MLEVEYVEKQPNLYSKKFKFVDRPIEGTKALRSEEIVNQTVIYNGMEFNADETAMDRMDRIVDIANWKYNSAIAQGMTPADAYQAVYIENTVPWKLFNNTLVTVTVDTLCHVQELALNKLGETWVKYG